jgi:hypothetical protein
MTFHHKYSIEDVENMVIYELDLYSALIKKYIEDKEREEFRNGGG